MQFCDKHWETLKTEIKERGLWGLVPTSGEQAIARMKSELDQGELTASNFDPLMYAHNAIVNNVMDLIGLQVLLPNEDGSDRCPLCYIQQRHDAECTLIDCGHTFDPWPGFAANDARDHAVRLGLMAKA